MKNVPIVTVELTLSPSLLPKAQTVTVADREDCLSTSEGHGYSVVMVIVRMSQIQDFGVNYFFLKGVYSRAELHMFCANNQELFGDNPVIIDLIRPIPTIDEAFKYCEDLRENLGNINVCWPPIELDRRTPSRHSGRA